jgi:hypothetical protein
MPLTSLDNLVTSYQQWLEVKAPPYFKTFARRLRDDREAARAEAVTFSILRNAGLNPKPYDDKGGPDFLCEPENAPRLVAEVTAIRMETVTRASGLPHEERERLRQNPRGFAQITSNLLAEAIDKATQFANYPGARLLVISTEHPEASLVMGARAATELLIGTSMISVRVGDVATSDSQIVATLKNSVFFRLTRDKTDVEPARQSISAVLLVTIGADTAHAIGLIHPAPAQPFNPNLLPRVHFLRLTNWPVVDHTLRMEWIGPEPSPTSLYHTDIVFTDRELRTR